MTDMTDGGLALHRRRRTRALSVQHEREPLQYLSADPSGDTRKSEMTFGATLRHLWRRRLLITGATLFGAGAAALTAWLIPPLYLAEARLIVGLQGPKVMNVDPTLADLSPDAERVQNESLILQSRIVAGQVVDKLKLATDPGFTGPESTIWQNVVSDARKWLPAFAVKWMDESAASARTVEPTAEQRRDRLIDQLTSRLDVAMLGRSHVLSVKAEAPGSTTAAAIANAFAELYLEFQRQSKIATLNQVDRFLLDRIDELRGQVRRSDEAVQTYRRLHGIYKSGTGSVASQQLSELNSQLMVAQAAKVEAQSRLDEAQRLRKGALNSDSVPEVLHSPVIMALKSQLADAERKVSERNASYGERHEMLRNARAEAGAIAGRINSEISKVVDGLEREARAATTRYDTVLANFERVKTQMGQVNEESIQLDALERDATVDRNLLEAVLLRAKQTMGTAEVVQANGRIVSPAAAPEKPAYPPKPLLLFIGSVGGLLLGACMAVLLERGDRTFRRPDQVESVTGIPVLAMIPQVRGQKAAQQILDLPLSPYSESLRRVAISVEFSQTGLPPKTVLISSSVPGEGKSVLAASLGRHLARGGRRVLLVDCDLRSPQLHKIVKCDNAKGLSNLLDEDDRVSPQECIHRDAGSGLDVIPAGPWRPALLHLLGADRMAHLVSTWAVDYDIVILDSSPVLATADSIALSRFVDKVAFVIRWGHTRQDAVTAAMKQLTDSGADIAGVVLSRVVAKEFRRYSAGASYYGGSAVAAYNP